MQQDTDPQHTAKTTKFIRIKSGLFQTVSLDSNTRGLSLLHLLKSRLKRGALSKLQLKEAALQAWKSITKEEKQSLVNATVSQAQ